MFIAFICFALAVAIGAYRQMCGVYELYLPYNCPPLWQSTFARVITWSISTVLSIVYAFILAMWVIDTVNDWVGKFSFGVFLVLRWQISALIGAYPAMKRVEEFRKEFGLDN